MNSGEGRAPDRWRRRMAIGAVALVTLAGAAGCGRAAATDDVASLGTTPGTTPAEAAQGGEKKDPADAMREFAKCMREHGIDMPDPEVGAGGRGNVVVGGPGGAGGKTATVDKTKLEAADTACRPLMENVAQDPDHQIDPAEEAKMKEQALGFSKCMREHGIDMPDPVFSSDGGGMTVAIGGPGSEGKGADPASPAFEEAQKACSAFVPEGAVHAEGGPVGGGGGPETQSSTESGGSTGAAEAGK